MAVSRAVAPRLESDVPKVNNGCAFDWNDLKYFLAVARDGSSLAAAKTLGTSQWTVHRRLKELEKGLGWLVNRASPIRVPAHRPRSICT